MNRIVSRCIAVIACLAFVVGIFACSDETSTPSIGSENTTSEMGKTMPTGQAPSGMEGRQPHELQGSGVNKMEGMVDGINLNAGQVTIRDDLGEAHLLNAGNDLDLSDFSVGDKVVVEYTQDMLIILINKQT